VLDKLRGLNDTAVNEGLKALNVETAARSPDLMFWVLVGVSAVCLLWAIWQSKRETPDLKVE